MEFPGTIYGLSWIDQIFGSMVQETFPTVYAPTDCPLLLYCWMGIFPLFNTIKLAAKDLGRAIQL